MKTIPTEEERAKIRQDALDNREHSYDDGVPCVVGHTCGRYAQSKVCIHCLDDAAIRYARPRIISSKANSHLSPSAIQRRLKEHDRVENKIYALVAEKCLGVVRIKRRRKVTVEMWRRKHGKEPTYVNGLYTFEQDSY